MTEFRLIGRVLPQWLATISLTFSPKLQAIRPEGTREYEITIEHGEIDVKVTATSFDMNILNSARIDATEFVGGLLGALSFSTAMPYQFVFDKVVPPGAAAAEDLRLLNPRLSALSTAFTPENNIDAVLMIMGDYKLIQIFNDLNMALVRVQYQPISCGRVLDGIRNYIAPRTKAVTGWKALHAALNVTQPYVQYVSKRSEQPRHRDEHELSMEEVRECLDRTWIVTNRLLIYCQRGKAPLTAPEFELL